MTTTLAFIIAFVSQKGGVGKSTFARGLAREAAQGGLKVKIADLDTQQGTCVDWHRDRLHAGIRPAVAVEAFATAAEALTIADQYDLSATKICGGRVDHAANSRAWCSARSGTGAEVS